MNISNILLMLGLKCQGLDAPSPMGGIFLSVSHRKAVKNPPHNQM